MPLLDVLRLLSFTVPTSWSLVLGWKAGGILGGMTGLIIGLVLGFACFRGIVPVVYHLMNPERENKHTRLFWMALIGFMWLVIGIWVLGFTCAGVALTQFLMRNR